MTRRCRVEYEGVLYHVLSRGNERENIVRAKEEDSKSKKKFKTIKLQFKGDHICSYGAAEPSR